MVLGGSGVLLSIAGVAGVWMVTGRLTDSIDVLASNTRSLLSGIGERSDHLAGRLGGGRQKVSELGKGARDESAGRLDFAPDELGEVVGGLRNAVERTRDWLAVARAGVEVVRGGRRVIDSVGLATSSESWKELTSALEQGSSEIAEAREALDELTLALDELERGVDGRESTAGARSVLGRCAAGLQRLEESIRGFGAGMMRTADRIDALANECRRRLRTGAGLITLLLLWHGLAQCCLVGWGKKRSMSGNRQASLDHG